MDEEIPKGQGVALPLICVYRRGKSLEEKKVVYAQVFNFSQQSLSSAV